MQSTNETRYSDEYEGLKIRVSISYKLSREYRIV